MQIWDFGECLRITEEELSSLSLETVSGWFDLELDTVICSNVDKDPSKCHVKKTSLIKKNEDGEYVLTDYLYEREADFSLCRLSSAPEIEDKKEKKLRREKAVESAEGLNIFNLSELSVRVYQNQKSVLDLEPQKCVNITEKELLRLTLEKLEGKSDESDFVCTNIKNSLNIHKCNVTKISVVKKNEDEEYKLTDYQGESPADFSQCRPLITEESLKNGLEFESELKFEPEAAGRSHSSLFCSKL